MYVYTSNLILIFLGISFDYFFPKIFQYINRIIVYKIFQKLNTIRVNQFLYLNSNFQKTNIRYIYIYSETKN